MATNGDAQSHSVSNGKSANGQRNGSLHAEKKFEQQNTQPGSQPNKKSRLATLKQMSGRPLPTEMGDGSYRAVTKRPTIWQDLKSINKGDLKTLRDIISAKLRGEVQADDKKMVMERTIKLVAGLPSYSKRREVLTNTLIDTLWNSLEHPPLLYMGDQYRYRQPDGSNNNPLMPKLGAAGTAYSRSCKPGKIALGALPDPEAVYESVMARDGFKKNPNNVSSILWYWATIIIHDLFSTNMADGNINDASSYLDLAPLYGGTQESQDSIRTFNGGKLKPDTFADKRLIGNPPGVCLILVMFNRVHNHVAANLAEINEGNRFVKPTPNLDADATAKAWKKYDEELFQTARLVTSGLYINITLVDYVRNIVNLNRVDTTWTLDPRQEMGVSAGTQEGSASGVGNVVSAEFNLCYRWHSCISEMDDEWIQNFYKELLGDDYGAMNLQVLIGAVKKFEMTIAEDPGERTFGGFTRGADGRFNDDELVECLATAIEQPGGAFGARNVPRIMKPVEMLGIIRGRRWNLAGLNEFRKHFGLKGYDTFEDINSDPVVAESLRNLYQHPDCVELYPGIVAEEAKTPMVPGVGIAPTYTISRVVLSDAVSLVRGDRYYTTDYHPGYLTNWGYKEVDYDLNLNHGCVFYKLFMRAFPNHFKEDSVYAHYPMVIPSENRKILTDLKRMELFSFDRPLRSGNNFSVASYRTASYILTNEEKYQLAWHQRFQRLMSKVGRQPGKHDSHAFQTNQQKSVAALKNDNNWKSAIKSFYSTIAEQLLADKSYKLAGKTQIDVVRDVGNLSHTHFAARLFSFPLKTKANPKGVFSEQELYTALSTIYTYAFSNIDPVHKYPLEQKAKEVAAQLSEAAETNPGLGGSSSLRGMFTTQPKNDQVGACGRNMTKALSGSGMSAQDVIWTHILPTASTLVPTQAQQFAQALDFYLLPTSAEHVPELHRIASLESSVETDAQLLGYALEGVRMAGGSGVYRNAVVSDTIIGDDGEEIRVSPGDRIHVSLASSAQEPSRFPSPESINTRRPLDGYNHHNASNTTSLGSDIEHIALVELFRAVFRKKGLRRVVGPQGQLKQAPGPDGQNVYLSEDWGTISPFPASMKVTWDGQ